MEKKKWNEYANKNNTRLFIKEFGRKPDSDDELNTWVNNLYKSNKIIKKPTINLIAYVNGMEIPIEI